MEPTAVERLNRVLDRLPRDTLHLGARTVPAFRSIGILGFHLAVLAAVLTAIRAGVPVLEAAGISATAGASFFAFGLLRRALTGRENLVLMEHVWVTLGSVALYLWAAGGPVLPGRDVLSAARRWSVRVNSSQGSVRRWTSCRRSRPRSSGPSGRPLRANATTPLGESSARRRSAVASLR